MITAPESSPPTGGPDTTRLTTRLMSALHSALIGGAIAAVASFIVFMATGLPTAGVLSWMVVLGMLTFSGTYLVVSIVGGVRSRASA